MDLGTLVGLGFFLALSTLSWLKWQSREAWFRRVILEASTREPEESGDEGDNRRQT